METEQRTGGVEAAAVVGSILRGLVALTPPYRLKDIESATGIAAPKLHRYLVSMVQSGLVQRAEDGTRYELGPLAAALGRAAHGTHDLVATIAPHVAELARTVGENAGIAVWSGDSAVVVRWFEGPADLSIALRPNARLGLISSTTGRVFGAYLPRSVTQPLVERDIAQSGTRDLQPETVFRQFAAVRRTGVAVGKGMRVRGINSLSAPVFGWGGEIAACITVLGPDARLDVSPAGRAYGAIAELSRTLSAQLGATRR